MSWYFKLFLFLFITITLGSALVFFKKKPSNSDYDKIVYLLKSTQIQDYKIYSENNMYNIYWGKYKAILTPDLDLYNQIATLQQFLDQGKISTHSAQLHLYAKKPYAIISN